MANAGLQAPSMSCREPPDNNRKEVHADRAGEARCECRNIEQGRKSLMFAPKMAKTQTRAPDSPTRKLAPQPSTLVARPLSGGAVEQARMLQRTIGNQATLRYLTQRLFNLPSKGPVERHEQEAAPENMMAPEAPRGTSWNFSKIPLFPPDRPNGHRAGPLATVPLPLSMLQPKLV